MIVFNIILMVDIEYKNGRYKNCDKKDRKIFQKWWKKKIYIINIL
jgi:hypothetical protein